MFREIIVRSFAQFFYWVVCCFLFVGVFYIVLVLSWFLLCMANVPVGHIFSFILRCFLVNRSFLILKFCFWILQFMILPESRYLFFFSWYGIGIQCNSFPKIWPLSHFHVSNGLSLPCSPAHGNTFSALLILFHSLLWKAGYSISFCIHPCVTFTKWLVCVVHVLCSPALFLFVSFIYQG